MKLTLLLVCALAPVFAQETAEHAAKIKDIKRLMVVMEAEKSTNQMFDQMAEAMKAASPEGDSFLQEYRKEMTLDKLMDIAVAAYDKHLTHEDVRELIRFYESPVGRRLVEAMPKISTEMATRSMELSQEIAKKVLNGMKQ